MKNLEKVIQKNIKTSSPKNTPRLSNNCKNCITTDCFQIFREFEDLFNFEKYEKEKYEKNFKICF